MALTQVYSAVIGHVITAARWNNEFGNIYANGTDLAFPVTKAVSLAGFTLTVDVAGATTLSSTASQGFILTPGAKSGTPSVNGSFLNLVAGTYTDSNTAGSGTAALWCGAGFRAPTLAATNLLVTTTDAATVHIEAGPTAGTNQTLTNSWALSTGGDVKVGGDLVVRKTDSSRTATVDTPLIVESTTTGLPANGIGTGILLRAESADETPSDIGQIEFSFTDKTAASEDSKFVVKTRVAGAALVETFSWQATSAFSAQFQHANTAARTYTLPDFSARLLGGAIYTGPSSTGTGSSEAHEGTVVIAADQALDGIHFYTDFTLNAGKIVTLGATKQRLIIVATGTITINGTIAANGAGSIGSGAGFSQPGGAGGSAFDATAGTAGGASLINGVVHKAGGAVNGGAGVQQAGSDLSLAHPFSIMGGAGGGIGGKNGGGTGVTGGVGGGSIVLIAPNIVFGAAAVLNTSGVVGGNGSAAGDGGGGGGGAGNIYVFCITYTDGGATFTMTAGAGGSRNTTGTDGGAGAAGVKQINIYA